MALVKSLTEDINMATSDLLAVADWGKNTVIVDRLAAISKPEVYVARACMSLSHGHVMQLQHPGGINAQMSLSPLLFEPPMTMRQAGTMPLRPEH